MSTVAWVLTVREASPGVPLLQERATNTRQEEEGQNLECEKFSEAFTMTSTRRKTSKICELKSILIKSTCSGITLSLGWIHTPHVLVESLQASFLTSSMPQEFSSVKCGQNSLIGTRPCLFVYVLPMTDFTLQCPILVIVSDTDWDQLSY